MFFKYWTPDGDKYVDVDTNKLKAMLILVTREHVPAEIAYKEIFQDTDEYLREPIIDMINYWSTVDTEKDHCETSGDVQKRLKIALAEVCGKCNLDSTECYIVCRDGDCSLKKALKSVIGIMDAVISPGPLYSDGKEKKC